MKIFVEPDIILFFKLFFCTAPTYSDKSGIHNMTGRFMTESSYGRRAMLVVDDEETVLQLTNYSIGFSGYECIIASQGEQAVDITIQFSITTYLDKNFQLYSYTYII